MTYVKQAFLDKNLQLYGYTCSWKIKSKVKLI